MSCVFQRYTLDSDHIAHTPNTHTLDTDTFIEFTTTAGWYRWWSCSLLPWATPTLVKRWSSGSAPVPMGKQSLPFINYPPPLQSHPFYQLPVPFVYAVYTSPVYCYQLHYSTVRMNESMCGTYYSSPTFTYKEGLEGLGLSIPMFIIHATYFPILLNFVIQVNIR